MLKRKNDCQKVLQFLKKNKISLLQLKKNATEDCFKHFLSTEDFTSAYNDELNHYRNWHNDFILIKDAWASEDIDYMFHKSTGTFPYMSDNLDVLVKSQDFKKAGEILKELGYVNLRNIQEAHKGFYRRFIGDEVVVPIHLHERVCWVVPFEDNEHLWNNYLISEDVPIVHYPSHEDCILINIAHSFLEDHEIKLFDLLAIEHCLSNGPVEWEYIMRTAKKLKWEHSLHSALIIFDHAYNELFAKALVPEEVLAESRKYVKARKWIGNKLQKILTSSISMPFVIPHLWTRIHTALRELNDSSFGTKGQRYWQVFGGLFDRFIHLKLGLKNHPSMFISFSGLDGSGKTRHIEILRDNFATCDIKTTHLWSRAGSFPFIRVIQNMRKLIKGGISPVDNVSAKLEGNRSLQSKLSIALWRSFNAFEMILLYFFKIRIPLLFGKVIIADRYLYDSIVDMEYAAKTTNFYRLIYSLLKYLTPNPDLVFFLDVDTDRIVRRCEDNIEEGLEVRRQNYKRVFSEMKPVYVDNNSLFCNTAEKISRIALRGFFSKYPDKFQGYKVISFRYK